MVIGIDLSKDCDELREELAGIPRECEYSEALNDRIFTLEARAITAEHDRKIDKIQDQIKDLEFALEQIRGIQDSQRGEFDPINKAQHYNMHPSGVECITVARGFNFNIGNVIQVRLARWLEVSRSDERPKESRVLYRG